MNTTMPEDDGAGTPELWRMRQVLEVVPFSRTTLWRRIRDGQFPEPVRLGGPQSRVIAWWSSDIEAWFDGLTA